VSSLLLYLLEYPAPLSELSSRLNLLSDRAELEGSGEVYLLYLLEDAGLNGVVVAAGSLSWPQDPPYAVVLAPEYDLWALPAGCSASAREAPYDELEEAPYADEFLVGASCVWLP